MAKTEALAHKQNTAKFAVKGSNFNAEDDGLKLPAVSSADSLESLASTSSPAPSPTLQAKKSSDNTTGKLGSPPMLVNEDIEAARNEWLFNPPSFMIEGIKTLLIDERDLPMALAFFNIIVTTLPAAAAVFYLQSHVFGLIYVVTNLITYQERFILGAAALISSFTPP